MKKNTYLIILLVIGTISCKNSLKQSSKLELSKKYYEALDQSDVSAITSMLGDSLLTRETEYDYEQSFSKNEYIEWLKWDSVFEPTYKIHKIEQVGEIVMARISKIDTRISFLHEEPIVTDQIVRFDNDKISTVETTKYIVFKDSVFVNNRTDLLQWIENNHPELNGFINDQTESGGIKYLKALEIYKNGD